jgi:hypothetical protein
VIELVVPIQKCASILRQAGIVHNCWLLVLDLFGIVVEWEPLGFGAGRRACSLWTQRLVIVSLWGELVVIDIII